MKSKGRLFMIDKTQLISRRKKKIIKTKSLAEKTAIVRFMAIGHFIVIKDQILLSVNYCEIYVYIQYTCLHYMGMYFMCLWKTLSQ